MVPFGYRPSLRHRDRYFNKATGTRGYHPCAASRSVLFCSSLSLASLDAATIARAAQWQRDNPELAERQAEFFHSLGLDPGGAVAKEELLALELSPDYRHECGICDRDYMLRRGCPCCRD